MTAATHVLRRLLRRNHHRSISGIGSVQLIRPTPNSRYYNPSPDLAGVRASTLSSRPCGPFASPPTGVAPLSFFSSLAGEEEAEVLDMERGTVRCAANCSPLTPLSFLERAAAVYGSRTAVVYAGRRPTTWREARERCVRVAAALPTRFGVARGDVVAVLSPNVPAMYELHFAVPMAGAVLCTLNTRHDAAMVSTLLKHSDAKVFVVESSLLGVGRDALKRLADSRSGAASIPVLVTISDDTDSIDPDISDDNELDPITLNYTSGTTSRPKGVICNHRGVYLNTIASVLAYDINLMPTYLWTVPMFHGDGWSMTWAVAMQGGTNICQAEGWRHCHRKRDYRLLPEEAATLHGAQDSGIRGFAQSFHREDTEVRSSGEGPSDGKLHESRKEQTVTFVCVDGILLYIFFGHIVVSSCNI